MLRTFDGTWSRVALLVGACTMWSASGAHAQSASAELVVPPPPDTAPVAAPAVEAGDPGADAAPVVTVAPSPPDAVPPAPQTYAPTVTSSAALGSPQYAAPPPPPRVTARPPRARDHRSDRATTGEVVETIITTAVYGVLTANTLAELGKTSMFDTSSAFQVHFAASVAGVLAGALGLLTVDTDRGVPTGIATGLRLGTAAGLLSGLALRSRSGEGLPIAVGGVIGGIIGAGVGGGLAAGLRPHPSAIRFTEAGAVWGGGFGLALGAIAHADGELLGGLMLGGIAAGTLTNAIVAHFGRVSFARGWLVNGIGLAAAGVGAFFTWGFSGNNASIEGYGVAMTLTGLAGVIATLALTDGMGDDGWAEDGGDDDFSLNVGIAPTEQGGMVTGYGTF